MFDRLKPKSEFSKNVLTLMTGSMIAQAIPIAISPILTRLYTPEDFGGLALFVAISSIIGNIANGRYELAIMLPKKNEDAINVFALGLIINVVISLFTLICIIIFHDWIIIKLNNDSISLWLYFIPLVIFSIGLFNLLNLFNNRLKKYKDLSKASIYKAISNATIQLTIGFFKSGVGGLITGQILSQIISVIKLFLNIKKLNLLKSIKKQKLLVLAKKYKDFPKYSLLSVFANTLTLNSPNIFISLFFNLLTLGYYSLVQKILAVPSALIGNAISQVFFQEAIKEKQFTGKAIKSFNNTLKKLVIIAFPMFVILYYTVEDMFAFLFGEDWELAGVYAKIVLPLFFVRFVSSSLSKISIVFEKQKEGLYINLILLLSSLIIFIISYFLNLTFEEFLYFYSSFLSIEYLAFVYYYKYLALGN